MILDEGMRWNAAVADLNALSQVALHQSETIYNKAFTAVLFLPHHGIFQVAHPYYNNILHNPGIRKYKSIKLQCLKPV